MFADYKEDGHGLLGDAGSKTNATFRLEKTNMTYANAIRRCILSHTPSVAFRTEPTDKSEVVVTENTSFLPNEMVVHRVGMLPIRANPVEFNPELYEFRLDVENKSSKSMDVCASDIEVWKRNPENPLEEPVKQNTADFFPPDPVTGDTCIIIELAPQWNPSAKNQRLAFTAKAAVSIGAENSRWSPVSVCAYAYTLDPNPERIQATKTKWLRDTKKIYVREGMSKEELAKLAENTKAVKWEDLEGDKQGALTREFNTMEIARCYKIDEKGEPNDFTFTVESVGIQPIPAIVQAGLAALEAMVKQYSNLDTTLADNVTLSIGDARFPCIDVTFKEEGHTLGNLLETILIEDHVAGNEEPKITYAGYKVPHPLRKEMFVRIGFPEGDPEIHKQTARSVLAIVCRKVVQQVRALQQSWKIAAGL